MLRYMAARVASGVAVFLTVTGLAFVLYYARGGDAIAREIVGFDKPQAVVDSMVSGLGLDRPLAVQYFEWLGGVLTGNLGTSFFTGQPVNTVLAIRIPVTVSLIVVSMLLTILLSVPLGVWAATRGGLIDRVVQFLSVLVSAVPPYLTALALVFVLALQLRLFPATGFIPITQSVGGWFSTVVLPSIGVALGGILALSVWIRSAIIDTRRQEWVRTLRSRGLSRRIIMYRYILRNAAAPTVQYLGLSIIGLLSGTVFVERIFNLPGLGAISLSAGDDGDIPVVLGVVVVFVLVIVIVNISVDLINGLLNPKVRLS